jgi:cytochrome c
MKKIFFLIATTAIIAACGGGDKKEAPAEEKKTETAADDNTSNPVYIKGVELVGKSDCATCHRIDEKNAGPAWRDVANKYPDSDSTINYLAHKIISGGSGVWGEVPMAPHADMPMEDAKALAKYVLLLKTNK